MRIDASTRVIYHNPAIQAARLMATYGGGGLFADLVSWWTLDETSSTRADSHGSNDLTDNGSTGYSASGKQGNAADLNGSTQYFTRASNGTLQMGGTDFTIALWCKADSIDNTGPIYGNWLINKRAEFTDLEYQVLVYPPSYGGFRFQVYPSGGNVTALSNISTISTGTWYFVVAEYDTSTATAQIYVNNTAGTSDSSSGTVGSGTAQMVIGAQAWSAASPWDGLIDEVAIWKRLLTSDEKAWLYNSGNGRTYTDLASYS